MRLSEKTVEINFCVQITPYLSGPAWWFGLTQKQEHEAGWDVASKVNGRWLRFQLKASNEVLKDGRRRFRGHHDQLMELQARAVSPMRVFYVLPTIGTTAELIGIHFHLEPHLRLLDVHSIPALPSPTSASGALRKNQIHYFDLAPHLGSVTIHSEPTEVTVMGVRELAFNLQTSRPDEPSQSTDYETVDSIRDFLGAGRNRVALFLPDAINLA